MTYSPPLIPKKSRTKVQASKSRPDKRIKMKYFKAQIVEALCHKILYMKPRNWGKADDNYLYLMWALITDSGLNWVKFIVNRMIHYKDNLKRPLFFSYFVQQILEVNMIVSKEEDLTRAPKILDYGGVSKMRYYKDSNGDYYYLKEYC
ncbi:hypothetical protein RYX36_028666 [Vicia faba]